MWNLIDTLATAASMEVGRASASDCLGGPDPAYSLPHTFRKAYWPHTVLAAASWNAYAAFSCTPLCPPRSAGAQHSQLLANSSQGI